MSKSNGTLLKNQNSTNNETSDPDSKETQPTKSQKEIEESSLVTKDLKDEDDDYLDSFEAQQE